jgi:tRNA(Ile)-lysidine synthase
VNVPELVEHVRERLVALGVVTDRAAPVSAPDGLPVAAPVIVACSGGLDSMVLLHLLRFAGLISGAQALVVAHLDHGMRGGSGADARWLGGVCEAWNVRLFSERLEHAPTSEAEARSARYAFFESVRRTTAATWILTAHHADDQAETVLFRVLRGSGIEGLKGIPAIRRPGIARPLLGLWREDLEAYAAAAGLRWRHDVTNDHLGYARNVLRHEIVPVVEARVAHGARRALVRLADVAAQDEAAWTEAFPAILAPLDVCEVDGETSFSVAAMRALGRGLRSRVLRQLAESVGRTLDHASTRRASAFVDDARSGTSIELGGGVALRRDLDRLAMGPVSVATTDQPLEIGSLAPGAGCAVLGGRSIPVSWSIGPTPATHHSADRGSHVERFSAAALDLPLTVRSREAGDRIALPGGTRKLKKILLEARIPSSTRDAVPVVVDRTGRVLWVVGVARTHLVGTKGETLSLRISE